MDRGSKWKIARWRRAGGGGGRGLWRTINSSYGGQESGGKGSSKAWERCQITGWFLHQSKTIPNLGSESLIQHFLPEKDSFLSPAPPCTSTCTPALCLSSSGSHFLHSWELVKSKDYRGIYRLLSYIYKDEGSEEKPLLPGYYKFCYLWTSLCINFVTYKLC